jgi:hypothetical protein
MEIAFFGAQSFGIDVVVIEANCRTHREADMVRF